MKRKCEKCEKRKKRKVDRYSDIVQLAEQQTFNL